ncbi:MAG TPA: hypothetical protein VK688_01645, partial [Gemmatimonadales bacterium]|nr:hypothetical protein [Gemmatimonadales bacterium]
MRPQVELVAGFTALALLGVGAAALGARGHRETDLDPRRSTFLTGPEGAQGYADALKRLRVRVDQFRGRPGQLWTVDTRGDPTVLAVLGPDERPDLLDAMSFVAFAGHDDLLLAGPRANAVMRCYGYFARSRPGWTLGVRPGHPLEKSDLRVRAVLMRSTLGTIRDSSAWSEDGRVASCEVPEPRVVDTLLLTTGGRLVAVRLGLSGGRAVTLVADDRLFSNRALRESEAGP